MTKRADNELLAEFFATPEEAAINRFAESTLAVGRRGERGDAVRNRYLIFTLGGEEFGLHLGCAREILKPIAITPVPRVPRAVLGVVSIRGRVMPVIDVAARLGVPAAAGGRGERFVCVNLQDEGLCLRVDAVKDVLSFSAAEIEPAPRGRRERDGEIVIGIGRAQDRMVVLLRLETLVEAAVA